MINLFTCYATQYNQSNDSSLYFNNQKIIQTQIESIMDSLKNKSTRDILLKKTKISLLNSLFKSYKKEFMQFLKNIKNYPWRISTLCSIMEQNIGEQWKLIFTIDFEEYPFLALSTKKYNFNETDNTEDIINNFIKSINEELKDEIKLSITEMKKMSEETINSEKTGIAAQKFYTLINNTALSLEDGTWDKWLYQIFNDTLKGYEKAFDSLAESIIQRKMDIINNISNDFKDKPFTDDIVLVANAIFVINLNIIKPK